MKEPLSGRSSRNPGLTQFGYLALCLVLLLGFLFRGAFRPGYTVASNDGPLGVISAAYAKVPGVFFGNWEDLNWLGFANPMPLPDVTQMLSWICGPLLFSRIYAPVAIFFLGFSAWFCFRQWKLSAPACLLGGLAAALNSDFFSTACWGVAAQPICFGFNFLALGALARVSDEPPVRRWIRVALAGLAVGLGVIEAFDIGAILSLFIAAFVVFQACSLEDGSLGLKLARGIPRLAIVSLAAGLIAAGALSSLYRTQIAETAQQQETDQEHWAWATQWSLPKHEVLSLLVPGLFGYRMDTPEGGNYWGAVGRDLSWDRYFAGGVLVEGDVVRITSPVVTNLNSIQQVNRKGEIVLPEIGPIKAQGLAPAAVKDEIVRRVPVPASGQIEVALERPQGFLRYNGGGIYAGVLVVLLALWTGMQAFRRTSPFFPPRQRRFLLFWVVAALVGMLLGFGRFAPFYRLFYAFPLFAAIRNPAKFFHVVNWALVILFAFGLDALARRSMEKSGAIGRDLFGQIKLWWKNAAKFDKNWVRGVVMAVVLSVVGWWAYTHSNEKLVNYLQQVDFDAPSAAAIASFSSSQVGWFVLFLALAAGVFVVVLSGYFSGKRATLGATVIGVVLVIDLIRANVPWVITYNYEEKYASNSIIDLLREKPFLHRASLLPFRVPPQLAPLNQIYGLYWIQHLFQYYNIQSLDVIMMPRRPVEYVGLETALSSEPTRRWELTNNRYLLGAAGFLPVLNQQLDPVLHRFKIVTAFDLVPKPGIINPTRPEEITTVIKPDGQYAVFEFTGALPRAGLFSNWQVNTNNSATLQLLAGRDFDPAKTVLVNKSLPSPSLDGTNQNPGTVEFVSYEPKHLVLRADATTSAVLLLNNKFDSNWKVSIDGKTMELLRCNYAMQGVQVPAGTHLVEFRFKPSLIGFYVNVIMTVIGFWLLGYLAVKKTPVEPFEEKGSVKHASLLKK